VTARAVLFEDRPDEGVEVQRPRTGRAGLDPRRLAQRCQRQAIRRRRVPPLVAADAGQSLAGLDVRRTPHRLHRHALFVQCLDKKGHAGRDAEMRRAVRLDRHRAQHELAGIVVRQSHPRIVHRGMRLDGDADQPQLANRTAGHLRQTLVHVHHDHAAFRGVRAVSRSADQAFGHAPADGQRRFAADLRIAVNQIQIAERVEQVQPQVVGRSRHAPIRPRRARRQRLSAP